MATQAFCGRGRPTVSGASLSSSSRSTLHMPIPLCPYQCHKNIAQGNQRLQFIAATPRSHEASTTTLERNPSLEVKHPDASERSGPARLEASASPSIGRSSTRDPRRIAAFAGALAAAGGPSYIWFSGQAELPPLETVMGPLSAALALMLIGVPVGLLLTKAVMGDLFHVELHRGRLYLCAGVPSSGPPLAPGAVTVRPTGDVRGNGAYAAAPIPRGTRIADYSGDRLDRVAFLERYPDSVGDYAMAVDDEWVIDAASIAPYTTSFHAVHMNHSRSRANVRRYYKRSEGRVSFFATRDIQPGEELLYDYGRAYWYGREHLELP